LKRNHDVPRYGSDQGHTRVQGDHESCPQKSNSTTGKSKVFDG